MPSQKKSPKKRGSKKGGKHVSRSSKAGLTFPVGRVGSSLKKGRFARRVSAPAAVFLTAVMEYCTSELLTLSARCALKTSKSEDVEDKQQNIKPRHICLAVRQDEDLSQLLSQVTISGGGVMKHVHKAVLKKKKDSVPSDDTKKDKKSKKDKKDKKKKKSE
eukprot:TRINITY_DN714_c1_g1_i1.p2 TRINITY_DN714_c1_g1~~TRINITY_DN714_c1_g1_i1.p2  ORF type:complete len:180 (+),score=94.13 TRINITY_DN714_c1_g1_i1:58-540(+)